MASKRQSPDRKRIARERIKILFREAEEVFTEDRQLSDRYVEIARSISMRHRVRMPRELRRRYCRKCHAFLVPGVNMRVRIHGGKVVITCRKCGYQRRYPIRSRYDRS